MRVPTMEPTVMAITTRPLSRGTVKDWSRHERTFLREDGANRAEDP